MIPPKTVTRIKRSFLIDYLWMNEMVLYLHLNLILPGFGLLRPLALHGRNQVSAERSPKPSSSRLVAQRCQKSGTTPLPGKVEPDLGPGGFALVAKGSTDRINAPEHLRSKAARRIRGEFGMPRAHRR